MTLKLKSFFLGAGFFFFALTIFFSQANAQGVWRLDGTDEKILPRNFRVIEDINSSASAQPAPEGIFLLRDEIKKFAPPDAKIFLVDLRQESHGFADGFPVSWYVEKNRGNYYKGQEEVEDDEIERLEKLRGVPTEFVPLGNYDIKHLKKKFFAPKETLTEREAAKAAGVEYVRFAATDMIFPAPQVVDEFLEFMKNLPENSWLHFHCHAGHGRTTTFLVFCEILEHPELSLEEICERQAALGGSNLLQKSEGTDWYAQVHNDRAEKLKLFYRYVREGHEETFSEFWQKEL